MANFTTWLARLGISRESIDLMCEKAEGIPGADLAAVSFALARDIDATPEEGHGVTITTIHGFKGREAGTVFLAGMEDEIIPGHRKDTSVEEERRLAYVAVTRAKDQLYLSYAEQRRQTWGDNRRAPCTPSRFLAEIGL